MNGDADAWQQERLRRYGRAVEYHRAVAALCGLDARTWLERWASAQVEGDSATAYALVHPEVAPLTSKRWDHHRGSRTFAKARRLAGARCEAAFVWGYDCPVHAPAAELELDHAWPFALGGPSAPSNGLWLCRIHNRAKSNDVHNYEWPTTWPSWLLVMTNLIRADCETQVARSSRLR